MTLIERCKRLDVLYLRWDRALSRWMRELTESARRSERYHYRKYHKLVGEDWQRQIARDKEFPQVREGVNR